jgi:hypothetical protein
MQPAPPLFRDFYPTYVALRRPFAVPKNRIVRLVSVIQFSVRLWAPICATTLDRHHRDYSGLPDEAVVSELTPP